MALVLVNKDGTSNAKPGDTVIHGGGMTTINKDGTKNTVPLPGVGTTKNYSTVVDVMNNMTKNDSAWATGRKGNSNSSNQAVTTQNPVEVFDSSTNYDDFTGLDFNYDPMAAVNGNIPNYSSSGNSVSLSNVVGYGIVALVLIAVLDKLIG